MSGLQPGAIRVLMGVLVGLAFVLGVSQAGTARANGVPIPVTLSYIDLSNWGPEDAGGEAELIFAEGLVRIDADGLPPLDDEVYQAWLVSTQRGDAISIGRFNADAVGRVSYQGTLPPIADYSYDLLMLTVEPDPDDAPQPSARRSIGGYFSLIGQPTADGSAAGGLQMPTELPNTGNFWHPADLIRVSVLAGAIALSVLVGLRLSRRHA